MHPVTVIIPTLNEAENLEKLLPMLQWADEIIIIDAFSTDNTETIVKNYNVKFVQHEYQSPSLQKNRAIKMAQHEWIFILDADERPTQALTEEIRQLQQLDKIPYDAYWIYRSNFFMGKKVVYSGWQNDKVIRFFRRDLCTYELKKVHEEIITDGKIGYIKARINHYTYRSIDHFAQKMIRYARWSAEDYADKTPKIGMYHLLIKPLFRFFKHYILKKGFLDGKTGFIISYYMAWGVFMRYAYLYESQKKD